MAAKTDRAGPADDGGDEGTLENPYGAIQAAFYAASLAFGTPLTKEHWATRLDVTWLDRTGDSNRSKAMIAAAFLREERNATPEACTIQLRLKGFRDVPEAKGLVDVAWRVFAFTLNALDAFDAAEREAAEAAARAAENDGRPRGALPHQLTNRPASIPGQLTQAARLLAGGRKSGK